MKKLISVITMCLILFTMMPAQHSLAAVADGGVSLSYKPEGLIYALGIVSEGENLSDNVSRGEFAVMLSSFLRLNTTGTVQTKSFNDIDVDSQYASSAQALYKSGYMSGDGNGNFRPDDDITYFEVIAAIVNVLDYGLSRYSKSSYPTYHLRKAQELDIALDKTDAHVTKGEVYLILELALEAPYYPIEGISDESFQLSGRESSVLEEIHKVYSEEGVVTQNSRTSLYSKQGSGEINRIGIDGKPFLTADASFGERLGEKIKYYYKNINTSKTVIYCKSSDLAEEVKIDSNDIESYSSYMLKYFDNENKREKSINIFDRANVIYNGVYYKKAYELTSADFEIDTGFVKLIANDGRTFETIIIEDYNFSIFDRLSVDGYKMFADANSKVYNFYDYDEICFIKDGKQIEASEILPGEVLNILEDRDSKCMTIYVTNETIEGTLISKEYSQNETIFTIDGKEYLLSDRFNELNTREEKIGRSDVFILDMFGRITAIENMEEQVGKYAVILGIAEGDWNCVGQVKFLNSKNRIKIYEITKKTKVNGVKYNSSSEFKAIADSSDILKGKLAAFDTNSQGELTQLNIEGLSGSELEFDKKINNERLRYKSGGRFFGAAQVGVRDYTSIFIVGSTITSDEDCQCVTASYLDNDSYYYISTYNYDDFNIADAIIIHEDANYTVDEESAILIVEDVLSALGNDDEAIWRIYGMRDGKESKGEFWFEQNGSSINKDDFAPGSVLLVKASSKGEILAVNKLFVYESDNLNFHYNSSSVLGTLFGRVVRAEGDKCLINVSEASEDLKIIKPSGDVYVFEKRPKQIRLGTTDDIEPGCLVFIRERYQSPREIVVFKE